MVGGCRAPAERRTSRMIQLRFVPIQQWPGEKTKTRQSSPFMAGGE